VHNLLQVSNIIFINPILHEQITSMCNDHSTLKLYDPINSFNFEI
jgi:hypothetical protein